LGRHTSSLSSISFHASCDPSRYPRAYPDYGKKYAVHVCKMVEGIKFFPFVAAAARL
jgi:hypothetical protein